MIFVVNGVVAEVIKKQIEKTNLCLNLKILVINNVVDLNLLNLNSCLGSCLINLINLIY